MVVRGVNLFGQPFEERTTTLAVNLHGCRYPSRHHLPKNSWVTIEGSRGTERHNVRARVAWTQEPVSVREYFQIAVEFESPCNIWVESLPAEWALDEKPSESHADFREPQNPSEGDWTQNQLDQATATNSAERISPPMMNFLEPPDAQFSDNAEANPFLRDLKVEIEQHAQRAAQSATDQAIAEIRRVSEETEHRRAASMDDFFQRWKEEFRQTQAAELESFASGIANRQAELVVSIQSEFENGFERARQIIRELETKALDLRAENDRASETVDQLIERRRQLEQAATVSPASIEAAVPLEAVSHWRETLQSEMKIGQAQWNELLQSSIDSGVNLLVAQLSEQSRASFASRKNG